MSIRHIPIGDANEITSDNIVERIPYFTMDDTDDTDIAPIDEVSQYTSDVKSTRFSSCILY